ncbi:MAG: ABC transporter permease [Sphingomonadaceae bacterium]|nr:ABC transporter permease [Sphingomonadaceae bacterium]
MSQAWRLALRDLRAGGRGLWLLAICLFVGTAALAGIGSLSASILAAIDGQSRDMLGGDLEMRVSQRRATVEEADAFAALGRVSELVSTRSMAAAVGGATPTLVTLKAVDAAWPLIGRLRLVRGAIASRPHGLEAAIAPALAERLGVHVGGTIRIGAAQLRVIGLIAQEPGALGQGFSFGPTAIVDMTALDATQTIQPGSLYESSYRILLPPSSEAASLGHHLVQRFPSGGWTARTPAVAAESLRRSIGQLGQFLLLIGLAASTIAAVGIGSGVGVYLGAKSRMIATLKVLGARSGTITALFLIELGIVGGAGVVSGLALGASVPAIVARFAGKALPLMPSLALYPRPLGVAASLSLIVGLMFALPALMRARSIPAASLLRDLGLTRARPRTPTIAGMTTLLALLIALTILTAGDRTVAAGFVAATMALLFGLWSLGLALRWTLARLPRPRRPLLRLALANLHRPGAQTDRLVVALGLSFSLFVALATIDASLTGELREAAPAKAPRFFAIDLQQEDLAIFRNAVVHAAPSARIETAPSLRGAIVALDGARIADMRKPPDSWLLRGDRTITWSGAVPARNRVTAGRWWAPGYRGPPLVSLEQDAARALGLKVGDMITVAVLGVEIPARIAALRKVDWGGLGLNFALVFSPGYIEEAPHGVLATVYAPPDRDGAIIGAVAAALPSVTLVDTGDLIGQIGDILGRVAIAVRAAAAVTILAGLVVLIGAVIASGEARRYDNVVLKLLGADRRQLLLVQLLEYLLLAGILCAVAATVGSASGWYVVTHLFAIAWTPAIGMVAATLGIAALVTVAIALIAAVSTLAVRPAEGLRTI